MYVYFTMHMRKKQPGPLARPKCTNQKKHRSFKKPHNTHTFPGVGRFVHFLAWCRIVDTLADCEGKMLLLQEFWGGTQMPQKAIWRLKVIHFLGDLGDLDLPKGANQTLRDG